MELKGKCKEEIKGYEGVYEIYTNGDVKSLDRKIKNSIGKGFRLYKGSTLKPAISGSGYYSVSLSKNGICKTHHIHRLLAEAFIPNPNNKTDVNHKDTDKLNNTLSNLEWATRSENMLHFHRNITI